MLIKKMGLNRDLNMQPTRLKSPDCLLRDQAGMCFELSTLLVSLLIGNGYDAYVVSGYASKQSCQCDRTFTDCPKNLQHEFNDIMEEDKPEAPTELGRICEREQIGCSEYWQMMESREKIKAQQKAFSEQEREALRIQELERIPPDELQGERVHSWVLISINKNEIRFIEPSTGVLYEASKNPFISVESLWNHSNYWVNMKPTTILSEMIFDLTNLKYWEHLLVAEPWHIYSEKVNYDANAKALKHFSMPPSWVCQLKLPERDYIKRYSQGHKTISYKKMKVEKFSPKYQSDGTILRLTVYEDYNYLNSLKILNVFHGRVDHLMKMKKNCQNGKVLEYFDFGRTDFLKKLEYFQDDVQYDSKMEFYANGRIDNLSSLSLTRSELRIYFKKRNDGLESYFVDFNSPAYEETIENMKNYINKITEKFSKKESLDDVETREYRENEIFLMYHYKDKEIIQKRSSYRKNHQTTTEEVEKRECQSQFLKLEQECRIEVVQLIQEIHDIIHKRSLERENLL